MRRLLKTLAVALALSAVLAVSAFAADFTHCADALHDLGLFQGTAAGYDLDRAPTRAEAATMLVRLLGKEADAKALTYTAPFTDVPAWAQPYVQYLYDNGLTTGKTAATFGSGDPCTAQQYAAFLLRALGYREKDGDFTYDQAIGYATEKGVVDYANCNQANFLRDHVAAMSYTALSVSPKSGETDLLTKLVQDGAIADDKGYEAKLALYRAYATACTDTETKSRMTMDMDLNATLSGQKLLSGTIGMDLTSDINPSKMDQSKIAATATVDVTVDPAFLEDGENGTMKTEMIYYYTDGYYYTSLLGQKIKTPLSFEDAMEQIGTAGATSSQPISLLKDISKATKSGSDVYTIDYAPAAFNGLMDMFSSLAGSTASGAEDISFTKMSTTATLKNGKLTNLDVDLGISMTVEDQQMQMDMAVKTTVVATGSSVTVKLPDDLSSYTLVEAEG